MGHENARERTCGDSVGAGGLRGPPRPGSVFQGACAPSPPAQRASSVAGRRRGDERRAGPSCPGQSDTRAGAFASVEGRRSHRHWSHFGISACHGLLNRALQQRGTQKKPHCGRCPQGRQMGVRGTQPGVLLEGIIATALPAPGKFNRYSAANPAGKSGC